MIASPHLSDEDIEAIKHGYEKRYEIIKNAVEREYTRIKKKESSTLTFGLTPLTRRTSDKFHKLPMEIGTVTESGHFSNDIS